MHANFKMGLWRLADPKISITSAAAMLIGAPVAYRDGQFDVSWLLITAIALFCMEVAKNAWGEVFDFDSGTDLAVSAEDRTNFSGGKRVLVENLLTRHQTWGIAIAFGSAGVLLGLAIVVLQAPTAFWLGALGLFLGWSYHGPPLQLAYRGLGEVDVVACYGPLLCLSTYAIQTNTLSFDVFWLSLPLGVLIAAFLWVNEFPDHDADTTHGKQNLVARLGKQRAARVLPLIYATAFAMMLAAPLITSVSPWVLLGLVSVVPAAIASVLVWQDPITFYRHRPVQPLALVSFVLYAVATCIGILIAMP